MHYGCRDNHNCGNSFVEFRDHNQGQHIGQERHYCGHETPPDFFSYGNEAQIIIALDEGVKFNRNVSTKNLIPLKSVLSGFRYFSTCCGPQILSSS